MATEQSSSFGISSEEMQEFSENLTEIASRSHALVQDFLERQAETGGGSAPMDPLNIGPAFLELTQSLMQSPEMVARNSMALWQDYMQLWQSTTLRMMGQETPNVIETERGDRRFKHADWQENQIFDFFKQSYLLASKYIHQTVDEADGLDEKTKNKIAFYTKQSVDALSPSNFVMTNPEALKATIESRGENLVSGLKNMLEDLESGDGQLNIRMTDLDAFEVGENVATTPGKVVFQNHLFQLIQYSPTTKKVFETPLVIFPPWINKFYILDLQPKNSFIRWAVAQGLTVFIVSWVNPDERHKELTMDDYLIDGQVKAIDTVRELTGQKSTHVIGYCIAGTLMAATLAWLKAKKQASKVKSATFFTAQVDFADPGDLQVFIDEEQLGQLDEKMAEKGYLDAKSMAMTFNMLRSNDLIWSFVVNNYLLGKDPVPFDLLYWNSDSTNLPYNIHSFYLREFYLENRLVEVGGVNLGGIDIDLSTVKTPCYIQAGREDHIAPSESVFKILDAFSGDMRFVLAGSGHIAGVVNPPEANKYQYWTNDSKAGSLEEWIAGASEHKGSWWPDWIEWISPRSGEQITAREPGCGQVEPLEDAPGSYVKRRA